MTDPIIKLLRELRPTDADQIDAIFPADEQAARLAAILAQAPPIAATRRVDAGATAVSTRHGPGERRRRTRAYRRLHRPLLTSALVAGGIAAVLLLVAGVLSGQGPTVAVPAQAAVLRGALRAVDAAPGTIVVESYDTLWPAMGAGRPFEQHQEAIYETPAGSGAQNYLISYGPGTTETVTMNGETEDYDPSNNTIYTAVDIDTCDCDVSPGSAPGSYVVSLRKTPGARRNSAAWEMNEHPPRPLTITSAQARALRDSADSVSVEPLPGLSTEDHGSGRWKLTIVASWRVPTETSWIQSELQAHRLKLDGTTTVNGRDAIELRTADGAGRYDVAPGTYYPIRMVVHNPGGGSITTNFSQYQVLPNTPTHQRLLSLIARHPGARIDNSHADYVAAETQLSNDSWPRATHPLRNPS
ncbi:MAG: hypothetical protein ACLP50_05535 [Solirubrobacteraceae bacterium]